jgi:hypothetical protein
MTQEKLERQRHYRAMNGNATTKKYEKTVNGFLMRLYRNMQSRISGVQKQKFHLYEGKELLTRNDFYGWAKKQKAFFKLFEQWEKSGYERKLAPSIDRIDSTKGYSIDNMEWVTHSENSRRGAKSPRTAVPPYRGTYQE